MRHIKRQFKIPGSHFFLLGPRGTGKSTLLQQNFTNYLYIDLLKPDILRNYLSHPERLEEVVLANPNKKIIIIDEIQKIPELLSVVHSLIEDNLDKQFILTGSSARKLRKQGVNLLGGRAYKKTMFPFSAIELGDKFVLSDALKYGLIPVVFSSDNKNDALDAYVDLYVREEVMMEGLTRNISNFSRFLEAVSFSHGSILNVTNIARDCHIERKTIESYIDILEDLMIAYKLNVFTKRAKRQITAHPKFYLFDSGLFRKLRPKGPLDIPEEIDGAALEGLVFQNLKVFAEYNDKSIDLFFWRTKSGSEVDFIVYGENIFFAIEVKNSAKIRPADLRSLKAFSKDYAKSKSILIYRGKEKLLRDNILIIPANEFLLDLDNIIKS